MFDLTLHRKIDEWLRGRSVGRFGRLVVVDLCSFICPIVFNLYFLLFSYSLVYFYNPIKRFAAFFKN